MRALRYRRITTLIPIIVLCFLLYALLGSTQESAAASSKKLQESKVLKGANTIQGGKSMLSTYAPLGKDIMPIGAWVAPPPSITYKDKVTPNYITKDNYKMAKDAGLNILYGLYESIERNSAEVMEALDCAEANGLKYLVCDSNMQAGSDDVEFMEKSLNTYKNHPAFLGNMMIDEPASPLFEMYGDIHNNYRKTADSACFYINVLPLYASKNQLFINKANEEGGAASEKDYQSYLERYVNTVKPEFISYDYYPLEGKFPNIKATYFVNMSAVRAAAAKGNIPFWVFIQSCSFNGATRIPLKAETFWQVNTALAYGSKGIQYFTFWAPLDDGFSGSIVSKEGKKTSVYYDVQEMNRQIAAVDNVLMNSTSMGLIIKGTSPAPVPARDLITGYKELSSIVGSIPTITGCFDYRGKAAYYIVNNTLNKNGEVTLSFKKKITAHITKNAQRKQVSGASIKLKLIAGEGVLVELK